MRDAHIMAMQEANSRRNGLVLAQFEFLKTRQEAFELVLRVSTWRDRLKWALAPAFLLAAVDAAQQVLLEKARHDLEAASAKARIAVVPGAVIR